MFDRSRAPPRHVRGCIAPPRQRELTAMRREDRRSKAHTLNGQVRACTSAGVQLSAAALGEYLSAPCSSQPFHCGEVLFARDTSFIGARAVTFGRIFVVSIHLLALALLFLLSVARPATAAGVEPPKPGYSMQGIYLQHYTAMTPKRLEYLIDNALDVGVDTLVVDLWSRTKNYQKAIARIQERGLKYVPRIVMFAEGGNRQQVHDQAIWEERWKLAEYALDLGAKDVQLDYIRYSSKTTPSPQNALDIREVLRFMKKRVNQRGGQLQIDVFGEVGYGPSVHIGQDMSLFAGEIDAVCPMVYPSHYRPYEEHVNQPYETVLSSLAGIQRQMGASSVPVFAYIELFNHRFKLSPEQRVEYIRAQLRAVREAKAQGWIAWSAGNRYDILFNVLRRYRDEAAPVIAASAAAL